MADVKIVNLQKSYGTAEILKDIDLAVGNGEFIVLVGPSGCGKSTLLRTIAGLEPISRGEIRIKDRRVDDLPPAKRGIAMVFQSYALYPHMDVYGNMAFGLKFAGVPKAEIGRRVQEVARMLRLEKLLHRKPRDLSGGQRQRVAIGRAIVREPDVFLFDEPLSNLDAALRIATRIEIAKLHRQLKATIIYVTHDQVEAMTLANRIVVMNEGRIEQTGKPLDLYYHPCNIFVASFIGSPAMNFISVTAGAALNGRLEFKTRSDHILTLPATGKIGLGENATIGIRPEHLMLGDAGPVRLEGRVDLVERLGEMGFAHLKLTSGEVVSVLVQGAATPKLGDQVTVSAIEQHVHIFNADGLSVAAC